MTSQESSQKKATLCLQIRGVGVVPSFKNRKRIVTNRKTGKPFLATRKDIAQRKEQITHAIELRLRCAYQTAGGETETGVSLPLWTRFVMPLDDSLSWIPEGSFRVEYVKPGEEGADILIEEI